MKTREQRYTEFRTILRCTDWTYNYAEGEAYYIGMKSYLNAVRTKDEMLRDFPGEMIKIIKIWNQRGKDECQK